MSALLGKIRSRGHWKVVIRPTTFVEKKVPDLSTLQHIVEKTSVQLKGWSFPHLDSFRKPDKGPDWIGQAIDWQPILELWRFYQSGQFVHYFGMVEDWSDTPNQWLSSNDGHRRVLLDVKNVMTQFTEMFEFAARLAFTEVGDAGLRVEITVGNIGDHFLALSSSPGKPSWIPEARTSEVSHKVDLSKTELVTETRELALKPATKLFQCFGWDPKIGMLRDIQSELLRQEQPR